MHELEAFLYFPNESNARRALPSLTAAGYTTYPEPTGDGRWVVEAVIRAAPLPEYIAEMRRRLRGVAGPLGGLYDGWSATPIDEEAEAEAARLAALEPAGPEAGEMPHGIVDAFPVATSEQVDSGATEAPPEVPESAAAARPEPSDPQR